ncbi:DUF2141 domain-containing protein [Hymenobacter cheonanensis]|uniref:DUF2141 domain-containing protein n=1 Tax=Hymenobacter sp. CA2-7 TaxID=3063993 RepID=UPI0027126263|nr:DUF2141 domain-containing protein [Hymenobacter sp. CA2-7]MDO7886059.1 DUF2141 domain-containing protein [Hymenobacter sp. CA2-7]
MKTLPLAALVLSGFSLGARPTLPPTKATETVTVVVSALASTQSVVKLNFYNAADKFLQKDQQAFRVVVKPEGKTEISVPVELTPGEWAVALTQDTNNNDKLDKNFLGIPTEPYAFSNNVRPRFAAPKFEECKFMVSGPGKVVAITAWN